MNTENVELCIEIHDEQKNNMHNKHHKNKSLNFHWRKKIFSRVVNCSSDTRCNALCGGMINLPRILRTSYHDVIKHSHGRNITHVTNNKYRPFLLLSRILQQRLIVWILFSEYWVLSLTQSFETLQYYVNMNHIANADLH